MRPLPVILASLALGGAAAFIASRIRMADASASTPASAPAAVAAAPDINLNLSPKPSSSALSASPSAPALEFLGALKLSTGLEREVRLARLALQRNADDANAWIRLGDALLQDSRETLAAELYAPIEKIYQHAHRLAPDDPLALLGLAWANGASHRFEDSVAWANLALKQDPQLAAAYGLLGDAAVELGNYAEAAQHYQRMLDLKPDLGALSRAAHLMYLQGNVPRAIALFQQAIKAGGSSPEHTAWCVAELSGIFAREGATLPALKLAEDALSRSPENPTLLAAVGYARMAAGNDTGAIEAYERSIALQPQHATLLALHDLQLAQNRRDLADQTAQRIRELRTHHVALGIRGTEGGFARFLADRGENLNEAVALAMTEYGHHHTAVAADTLAWTLFRAGRKAEALPVAREAIKHRVPDATILYHTAMIEEANDQTTDARRHLNAAVTRQPRFNPLHAPLAFAAITRLGSVPAAELAQAPAAAPVPQP